MLCNQMTKLLLGNLIPSALVLSSSSICISTSPQIRTTDIHRWNSLLPSFYFHIGMWKISASLCRPLQHCHQVEEATKQLHGIVSCMYSCVVARLQALSWVGCEGKPRQATTFAFCVNSFQNKIIRYVPARRVHISQVHCKLSQIFWINMEKARTTLQSDGRLTKVGFITPSHLWLFSMSVSLPGG